MENLKKNRDILQNLTLNWARPLFFILNFMADRVRNMESVEEMKEKLTGEVYDLDTQQGKGFIHGENGKKYEIRFQFCKSTDVNTPNDTFNNLSNGARVTFQCLEEEKQKLQVGRMKHPENYRWLACDIALDTSSETSVLVPKTENAVAGVLDIVAESPECSLEDEAFRIDSTGWQDMTVQDSKGNTLTVKANQGKDVCELPSGVQIFTPVAMFREVEMAGRKGDIITGEQAQWLLKNTSNNVPEGCKFEGFIDSKEKLLFEGENACYWIGDVTEKGNQKALFCIDISTVDEEMRPYIDEMIISDYDMESIIQVRLLKNSNKLPPPPEVIYVDPSIFQKTK